MCTPVGHTLIGATIGPKTLFSGRIWPWFWLLILANLPDVDFLFGWAVGFPNRYHHGWTHSLGFVGLVMLGVILIRNILKAQIPSFWIWASGWIVFSHLVLDFFTLDRKAPFGIPFFWPFSSETVISPVPLFRDVQKGGSNAVFIASLFSVHNGLTVLSEVLFLAPWLGIRSYLESRRRRLSP